MTGEPELEWRLEPDRTLPLDGRPAEWCYRVTYRRAGSRPWRTFLLLGLESPSDELVLSAIAEHEQAGGRP